MAADGKVLVVMGSTRAGRICPKIAAWVQQAGAEATPLSYELVDLADWHLPVDDEPAIPALGSYDQAHTRAWSEKVQAASAVVFVTPQFNWGYPAVLKNAIDHLYHEWRAKPVAIVTYGGHGGTRCARQLRRVAAAVKMRVVARSAAIWLPEAVIREGAPFEPARDAQAALPQLKATLADLAALVQGCESAVAGWRRRWSNLVSALT